MGKKKKKEIEGKIIFFQRFASRRRKAVKWKNKLKQNRKKNAIEIGLMRQDPTWLLVLIGTLNIKKKINSYCSVYADGKLSTIIFFVCFSFSSKVVEEYSMLSLVFVLNLHLSESWRHMYKGRSIAEWGHRKKMEVK